MSKRVLAVFDSDIGYVDRFLRYMKSKRNLPFKTVGFSSLASLELFLERNRIDILLLSDASLEEDAEARLCEHPAVQEVLLSGDEEDLVSRRKKINRYRPAEEILSDVIRVCRLDYVEDRNSSDFVPGIIGIYSPICNVERQDFALAAAHVYAATREVLYLSLERFSGMRKRFALSHENTISDLIYFFKTNRKKIRECLSRAVVKQGEFDLLLAPFDQEDLDLIEEGEWKLFLHLLAECGSYDVIVLDLADAFRRPELIFALCEKVFVPVTDTRLSAARMEELRYYLSEKEGEKFLDRFLEVPLEETAVKECSLSSAEAVYPESCFMGTMKEKAEQACICSERGMK